MAKKVTVRDPGTDDSKQRRDILRLLPRIFLGLLSVALGILFLTNSDLISSFLFYIASYVFGVFFFIPGVFFIALGIWAIVRAVQRWRQSGEDKRVREPIMSRKAWALDICCGVVAVFLIGVLASIDLESSLISVEGTTLELTASGVGPYFSELMRRLSPVGFNIELVSQISSLGGGFLPVLVVALGNSMGIGTLGTTIIVSILLAICVLCLLRHPIKAICNTILYIRSQIRSAKAIAPKVERNSKFRQTSPEPEETPKEPEPQADDTSAASESPSTPVKHDTLVDRPTTHQSATFVTSDFGPIDASTLWVDTGSRAAAQPAAPAPEPVSAPQPAITPYTESDRVEKASKLQPVEPIRTQPVVTEVKAPEPPAPAVTKVFTPEPAPQPTPITTPEPSPAPAPAKNPEPVPEPVEAQEAVPPIKVEVTHIETIPTPEPQVVEPITPQIVSEIHSSPVVEPVEEPIRVKVESRPVSEPASATQPAAEVATRVVTPEPVPEPVPVINPEPKPEAPIVHERPVSTPVQPAASPEPVHEVARVHERPAFTPAYQPEVSYSRPRVETFRPDPIQREASYSQTSHVSFFDSEPEKVETEPETPVDQSEVTLVNDLSDEELKKRQQEADNALDAALKEERHTGVYHPAPYMVQPDPVAIEPDSQKAETPAKSPEAEEKPTKAGSYIKPSVTILKDCDNTDAREQIDQEAGRFGAIIMNFLQENEIPANYDGYESGASVTRYRLRWKPKAKTTTITNNQIQTLSIKLGGKTSVRFVPLIEGRDYSAIEVPNPVSMTVPFRDAYLEMMREDRACLKSTLFPIGQDLNQQLICVELEKMPHLLVAGSTNSGKTVFIHSLICGMIMRTLPSDLKFILIDPKHVEFNMYEDMPHLFCPVVTESEAAVEVLRLLVDEMERRYSIFQKCKIANLAGYRSYCRGRSRAERLPIIVVIIDEFADLMMSSKGEASDYVARLAAKARACGIHLVVATQRPSTSVITGDIKNNIPARIGLLVPSGIDSRVILDEPGAEQLTGRGDLLARIPGKKTLSRCQSPYISNEEIIELVDYLRSQAQPVYDPKFVEAISTPAADDTQGAAGRKNILEAALRDPEYLGVRDEVLRTGQASANYLHRHFNISANQARNYLDAMEAEGLVETLKNGVRVVVHRDRYEDDDDDESKGD